MKKILLVTTSFEEISLVTAVSTKKEGFKTDETSHYPLGLAYIHSFMESQGHKVESLFLNNTSESLCFDIVREKIKSFNPDFIGFQILTPNRVSTYRLIEYLYEHNPRINIIAGGIHASEMYEQIILKYPYLVIVIGEGEETLAELVEVTNDSGNLESVAGIAFYRDGRVIVTQPRTLIRDLDRLPYPKHEVFFTLDRKSGCIITTRGYPFRCSFCNLHTISMRKVRFRSVKNVVDEISEMIRQFPQMENIWIHDDTFFLDNERVMEFCDEIVARDIKVNFTCSGRMKPLSEEMIPKLEKANFKLILFGLESGNEQILKDCKKKVTREDAMRAFTLFAKSPINIYAFLIVGLPGETEKTINDTIQFVKKLQKTKYVYYKEDIAILSIYPGTEIYGKAVQAGLMTDEYWLNDNPIPLFTVENSVEELISFKEKILNHISLDRFYTLKGFLAQWTMIPAILEYRGYRGSLSIKLGKYIVSVLKKLWR